MLSEIPLTKEEKLLIERHCIEEVARTEKFIDELRLPKSAKEEIVGSPALPRLTIGFALVTGIVSLTVLRWLDSLVGYTSFFHGIGLPFVLTNNLPELLTFCSVAMAVWVPSYSWAVEGRYHWATTALNAQKRASVLHSVVECLAGVLGDSVPDLSDYDHVFDDAEPNCRIDKLLNRENHSSPKVKVKRRFSP